jgi:HK97 gp10 family phage protein
MTINTRGFADLEEALKAMGADVATKIGRAANRKAASVIGKAVKEAAPVGPRPDGYQSKFKRKDGSRGTRTHGKLKTNLKIKNGRVASSTKVKHIIHTGNAFHALMVEKGTVHMQPKPWFKPALDAAAPAAIEAIKTTLARRIKRGK